MLWTKKPVAKTLDSLQDQVDTLNSKLTPTNWIDIGTPQNGSYAKYKVSGNIVTVVCMHKATVATISAWQNYIFGKIPDEYRPKQDVFARCVTDRDSGNGCSFCIGTNGNVFISGRYSGLTDSSDIIYASVTYVI